jgi:hypothetical protein
VTVTQPIAHFWLAARTPRTRVLGTQLAGSLMREREFSGEARSPVLPTV